MLMSVKILPNVPDEETGRTILFLTSDGENSHVRLAGQQLSEVVYAIVRRPERGEIRIDVPMMGLDVLKTEAEYKKGGVMKYHYLIDYENVREKGLEGVFWLSPEDSIVYVFYTKNANTVKMDLFMASFEKKIEVPLKAYYIQAGKQSLDMESRYLIISKDSDFMNTISFWQGIFGNGRVEQYPSIEAALYLINEANMAEANSGEAESEDVGPEETKKTRNRVLSNVGGLLNNAIQTALSKNRVDGNKIAAIASMVVAFCREENHKEIIMECLVKKYGSKEATQLFTIIEPLL